MLKFILVLQFLWSCTLTPSSLHLAMVSVRKAIAALSWMLVLRSSLCKQGLQGEYWGLQSLCCSSSVLFGHSFYCLTVPIIHFRFPLLIKSCHVYAVIIIKTVVLKIQKNDQPLYIFMLFWLFLKLLCCSACDRVCMCVHVMSPKLLFILSRGTYKLIHSQNPWTALKHTVICASYTV